MSNGQNNNAPCKLHLNDKHASKLLRRLDNDIPTNIGLLSTTMNNNTNASDDHMELFCYELSCGVNEILATDLYSDKLNKDLQKLLDVHQDRCRLLNC